MPSPPSKTRREAVEPTAPPIPEAPPAPPTDPPPPPASASSPPSPWHPGPLSGSNWQRLGSWVHPSGRVLELSVQGWELTPGLIDFARLRSAAQAEVDEQDRRTVADAVAAVAGDPALQAAEEVVKRLPKEVERLEAVADEWAARVRRLKATPGSSATEIAEATSAVDAAERDREFAEEQLARARADLAGLLARQRRLIESAATGAISANRAALEQQREKLLREIIDKVSPELVELTRVELRLLSANREQQAMIFATEFLATIGIDVPAPPPPAPAPPPVQPIFARAHATQSATVPAPSEDEGRTFSPAGALLRG
jgi:hypothetical protein